jgi:hypothetical protein
MKVVWFVIGALHGAAIVLVAGLATVFATPAMLRRIMRLLRPHKPVHIGTVPSVRRIVLLSGGACSLVCASAGLIWLLLSGREGCEHVVTSSGNRVLRRRNVRTLRAGYNSPRRRK